MQGKDFYKILGVDKSANKDDIKKAFRKLAHQYHPDKKGGDEAKFKEVNEAYAVLSDDKKRAQYDQFGSGFQGGGPGGGFDFKGQGFDFSQFQQGFQGAGFDIDLDDILGSFFGGRTRGWSRVRKGADIKMDIEVDFNDSITGTTRSVNIKRKKGATETITLDIPAGIESGEMLRFRGKGEPSEDKGGASGDLYIRIFVKQHKIFRKEGIHLFMEKEIKLTEAISGTDFDLDVIDKKINIKIPAGINNQEILRVKGRGVQMNNGTSGDLLIKIKVKMPHKISSKAKEALETLKKEGF